MYYKTVQERKILEVNIDKGMASGHQISFRGEGNQEPGSEPGDIIIQLEQRPHSIFRRDDNDLYMPLELTLSEALCGFRKTITTLDERCLVISGVPGEVIKPNSMKFVPGKFS